MGNAPRGIFIGLLMVLPFWALVLYVLLTLLGCDDIVNLTPTQEELRMDIQGAPEDIWISSEKLEEILPEFAVVEPGVYKLVPRGIIAKAHDAPWCAPKSASILYPKHWDCNDYAKQVVEVMRGENYAVGYAYTRPGTKYKPGHVVVIAIDQEETVILYEPETCQFTRMEIARITI